MLKIMHALIAYHDLAQYNGLNGLAGKSHDNNAILNIHFIAEVERGIVFSALVDSGKSIKSLHYQPLSIPLYNVLYRNIAKKRKPPVPVSTSIRSLQRYQRKIKNLTMTDKNWKQFIESKKCILAQYKSCEIAHPTISHKQI